jgi:hypothetical protein
VLVPQKVAKEDDTQPSRPCGSLALLATAATLNFAMRVSLRRNSLLCSFSYQQSKRSRNSTWQLTNNISCCGIQTVAPFSLTSFPLLSVMEWDLSRQTHTVAVLTVQKLKFFSLIYKRRRSRVFRAPICRAE